MKIGIQIQLPGIRGASNLDYTLPDSDQSRKIKSILSLFQLVLTSIISQLRCREDQK